LRKIKTENKNGREKYRGTYFSRTLMIFEAIGNKNV